MNGPAGNLHAAGNQGLFAFCGLVAYVMAVLATIAFVKVNRRGERVGAFAKNDFDVTRHGAVNGAHGFLRLRNRLEGSILSTFRGIVARRGHVEGCLGGSKSRRYHQGSRTNDRFLGKNP